MTGRLARISERGEQWGDRLATALAHAIPRLRATAWDRRTFLFAVFATLLFYAPALASRGSHAGFLYSGDVLGWYLPSLAKTHQLISAHHFIALDFSRYNGSSDFYLTPAFFYFHPLVVAYGLLAPDSWATMGGLAMALLLMSVVNHFIAAYYTARLCESHLGLPFGYAVLATLLSAFSMDMMASLFQPSFLVCTAVVPWMVCAALDRAARRPSASVITAALPVVLCMLGGYLPLGVACILLAVAGIIAIILSDDAPIDAEGRIRRLIRAAMPFLLAGVVLAPFLFAVFRFHLDALSSHLPSIEYAAYDLAEKPQNLVRFLSAWPNLAPYGPYYEFSFLAGLSTVMVGVMLVLSPAAWRALRPFHARLLMLTFGGYVLTVLATLGEYSVVADFVYYYVPQVGNMHIYQRFLLPAQWLLALATTIACLAVFEAQPVRLARAALLLLVVFAFAVGWEFTHYPSDAIKQGLNPFQIVEAFLAAALAAGILAPGRRIVVGLAIVVFAFAPLDKVYDLSKDEHSFETHRKRSALSLDDEVQGEFMTYLHRIFPDRKWIRYADLTPIWKDSKPGKTEYLPKNFPYLVLQKVSLVSYTGTPTHLSSRKDYARKMPVEGVGILVPDWELLQNSGADFIAVREEDMKASGSTGERLLKAYASAPPADIYRLPNDVLVIPTRYLQGGGVGFPDALYGSEVFRAIPAGAQPVNLSRGKRATQSSGTSAPASLAVDGNTDGDFKGGSVSHTDADPDAWLDIDLGEEHAIDTVAIWNRTDCCGSRLRDYWLFISDHPFAPKARARDLREAAGVTAVEGTLPIPVARLRVGGAKGRYVRVQLAGTAGSGDGFLSMAEVEVFEAPLAGSLAKPSDFKLVGTSFDGATTATLSFENTAPIAVQYLFSGNPRLRFTLDGEKVLPVELASLLTVQVPPGRHVLEVRYHHPVLVIFWLVYAAFLAACVVVALLPPWRSWRARRRAIPAA